MPNILLLSCSPRSSGSCAAIGRFLESRLTAYPDISVLSLSLSAKRDEASLIEKVSNTDVLVLAVPVYENSVPGPVMRLFEQLSEILPQLPNRQRQLFVVTASGFCELSANHCTLETCRLFAQQAGFEWLGGVSAVPGPIIEEKALAAEKGMCKKLASALTLAAKSLAQHKPISDEVYRQLSKPLISRRMYNLGAHFLLKRSIKELGKENFYATPLSINSVI